ncbi:SusD/RagB family nutrient-binding outer membrane lipoprotein [Arcticibacter tournemirensis]|uniref:SusD/RagB family nutrient-binding outer membrane lipoprotein n=1 Tax=Arcticibacter tournemirensis TaxID=699437 RepID=A0A4Q0MBF5_9SPHI|nr:SusD/RagB family nutrient-binding outer membrane lipoprotein [Arcticibacter tournemirensis]RXF70179.1 SusD/RagB family nutrient-binding outer membrane lipoprotein [Arcticibacter tournemirensis]
MKIIFCKIGIPALVALIILSSCTKSFEEVNTDPDALTTTPPTNQLANVIRNTGEQFGGDVDGFGTFAGYIVKIQYLDYMGGLKPDNNGYGNRWYACYYNNTQLKDLLEKTEAAADSYKNIRMVARIWQCYMWQYLTDGWRDVPYTEALKGSEEEGSILRSKYDKQEDIYPSVMADLKAVADEMAAGFGTDELGEGDLIYKEGGREMERWQRFCNSLRLRMAIRISGVSPVLAKSTIEEICGNPDKYPVIESNVDNCYLKWPGAAPYYEPWYKTGYVDRRIDNFGMSDIFIDHLKQTQDPRIRTVANAASDGEYRGYQNGAATIPPELSEISFIGDRYMKDAGGFTPFFKSCESYYIIAEAAMLGYSVGISAQNAYEKAVRLSMEDNGLTTADANTYLAGKGKWNNTKERIWWDMWVALFKNNFEAWALYRRTGIPSTNYPSLNSVYGDAHNDQPFRIPYPNNQYLYNKKNLDVVLANVVDYAWGQQMWWDTRTGVK